MKKIFFILIALTISISSCLPAGDNLATPDLNATAAILSQQTLEALAATAQVTATIEPSITPVVLAPTKTSAPATATETQNSLSLTPTVTLGTGTSIATSGSPFPSATAGSPTVTLTGTLPLPFTSTPSATSTFSGAMPSETAHPIHSGTMPPALPYGFIELRNKSKTEVYISMRCVTKEGYVTIIEYPVKGTVDAKGPAGRYTYVVWVGGRKIDGSFSLKRSQDLVISIFKDHVTIK